MAGGLASRAGGVDKGKFTIGEKSFFEKLLLTFKDLHECMISYNRHTSEITEYLQETNLFRRQKGLPNVAIIADRQEVTGIGPIAGLYSVLKATDCDGVIFCPCDVPYFSREIVTLLLQEFEGNAPLIMKTGGKIQSLCGIYPKNMLPEIEECIRERCYKIRCVLDKADARYLEAKDYGIEERTFCNINTIEEWKRLRNAEQNQNAE